MRVNGNEMAEILGIDRRTLTNWLNANPPVPSEKVENERRFDPPAVLTWLRARDLRQAVAAAEKELPTSLEEERTRLVAAQARLAEMDVATRAGELVPIEAYRAELNRVLGRVRARFQSVPGEYASQILEPMDMAKAVVVLRNLVATVLSELQGAGEVAVEDDGEEEEVA